jgi:hypothetical protein
VIQGEAPTLLLRGMGLHLSMVSGFNGVMNVVIITDMVARRGTPRRKVTTLLLPRLGASGLRPVKAIAGGAATAPYYLRGVSVGAPPPPRWWWPSSGTAG